MVDVINLPPLPGLPDVALAVGVPLPAVLIADDPGVVTSLGSAPFGIFSNGVPVIVADTVMDLGLQKTFTISDYPTEEGGFASYDSQEAPAEARVRLVSGGSLVVREALLESVVAIVGDLNTYSVVTPEKVYDSVNLTRYEFRRSGQEGGASLLAVDVVLEEVRVAPAAGPTGQNTIDPASADPVNGGIVQPQNPTPAQTAAALPFFASGAPLPLTLGGTGL